ncbi:Oidioi.mRNA.OKI2018_I69.chr2.g4008.t1.cds [Oikopleura dioica]|uniref:Oidioi.mRNA.OKI2018_I69.chr2.g4008.t1.cds n=1 Tax=Oikopleura dioica TaxID=34765 RepID=A0ABN7T2E8_OIKDI|nr:Oidioi.mRNA.OKI2018_I69.chr2.g4008.t1.cds [Oikopleura dioica]
MFPKYTFRPFTTEEKEEIKTRKRQKESRKPSISKAIFKMPFYVVENGRGFKFGDGLIVKNSKKEESKEEELLEPEDEMSGLLDAKEQAKKKNETSEEGSGSDSEEESEEEGDLEDVEIDEIGSELDKGLDRLDCAVEDEMKDNSQQVIYLTDISHSASIAGEFTDQDSYMLDEFPDQNGDQTSYLLV